MSVRKSNTAFALMLTAPSPSLTAAPTPALDPAHTL